MLKKSTINRIAVKANLCTLDCIRNFCVLSDNGYFKDIHRNGVQCCENSKNEGSSDLMVFVVLVISLLLGSDFFFLFLMKRRVSRKFRLQLPRGHCCNADGHAGWTKGYDSSNGFPVRR